MRGLAGKKVLITGAGRGIGKACALRFHEEGAAPMLVDMAFDQDLLDQLPNAPRLEADISSNQGLVAIQHLIDEHGLDILINNAGITRDASTLKLTDEQWDQVLAVNLSAVFKLSRLAAHYFAQHPGGVILNAASVVAHYGNYGQANYVAAKAGVVGLTKTLAKELGRHGVRVNAVAPGFVATPMVASVPEKVLEMMQHKTPLGRVAQPEEIAAAYAFLASDDASYITGATLNVDGGLIVG